MIQKTKQLGQTFTPNNIVNIMLDMVGYVGDNILKKHVIDNSCGDGSILKLVLKRYCETYIKKYNTTQGLKEDIETYIHGIEIDDVYDDCIQNLIQIINEYGVSDVKFDILHANTLCVEKYNNKMDFVIGNPPYVRVHNLNTSYNDVRDFSFSKKGMTDLYITFFEIGIKMLKNTGKLIYITPISWITSSSGLDLRKYIFKNNYNISFVDFEHYQVFKGVTTYSLITMLDKNKINGDIVIYKFNKNTLLPDLYELTNIKDIFINDSLFLIKKEHIYKIKNIIEYKGEKYVSVKNGFATLCDDVFYNVDFDDMTIDVIKSTTTKKTKCLYPYDKFGKEIDYDTVMSNDVIKDYYLKNKNKILKNKSSNDNRWIYFGRTQGLNDVYKLKYTINMIVKTCNDFKITKAKEGVGVYGGLYILPQNKYQKYGNKLNEILKDEDIMIYIKSLKKYKSGGYYTFSSNDIEKILNYKISLIENKQTEESLW